VVTRNPTNTTEEITERKKGANKRKETRTQKTEKEIYNIMNVNKLISEKKERMKNKRKTGKK
jgi:hypothetical protein